MNLASTVVLAGVLALFTLGVVRAVPDGRPANVAAWVWQATERDQETDFLVIMEKQADLSPAIAILDRGVRLRYVYETLWETAWRSQAPLRARLERLGIDFRPFYIVNMMAVTGERGLVTRLASRPDVARIVGNPRVRQQVPEPAPERMEPLATQSVAWNVAQVNADDVWALGHTGEGIVVAGQDTGYDWAHPALATQYRGYNGVTATHDYNWHDAIHSAGSDCGADSPTPCDDNGHGTHTMGTLVGDDGLGNQIGVAPGARWIGCRNMNEGFGTPATYAECFEFFLAPYPVSGDPSEGDPAQAPHVINNSWTCPPYEGCDWDTLQQVVEHIRAAGILVVASAGNSGSSCSTVQDPPAIYDAAFSVGATNSNDYIASFSSRGPVTIGGLGWQKPDISAPGVDVRSSVPGGGYQSGWRGTSMAGPHVSGAAALLWSAAPELIGDIDGTETLLTRTARPRTTAQGCGDDGPADVPNNAYGWGVVDALAAVQAAHAGMTITKQATIPPGLPVRTLDYTITATNMSVTTLTQVVLTDALPAGTTFARASGDYAHTDAVVTWTLPHLAPGAALTATLTVSAAPGTRVVNARYGVLASEHPTPVMGAAVETTMPWRYLLIPIFKQWTAGGDDE